MLEREGFVIETKVIQGTDEHVWLLTWNPNYWSAGGIGGPNASLGIEVGDKVDWRCLSKKPNVGDYFYLLRTGVDPKGIIAKGVVTHDGFSKQDSDNAGKDQNYITVKFEEIRQSCADGLLPSCLLKTAMPEQDWSPQSSGISVKSTAASELNSLWDLGRGKSSLRQFVDWSEGDPTHGRFEWYKIYTEYSKRVEAFKISEDALDSSLLELIWKTTANGVASVAPGPISNADYESSQDILRTLVKAIRKNPSHEVYQNIYAEFEKLKQSGSVRQIYKAAINRVFAGLFPEKFTTIVGVDKCKKLMKVLNQDFQLDGGVSDDWYLLNAELKKCMAEAELDASRVHRNNIAMWQLYSLTYETHRTIQKTAQVSEPQTEQIFSLSQTRQVGNAMTPLNRILYGPPGTGKTYHTINAAISIIEPDLNVNTLGRKELKAKYDRYVSEGRIHFVTFHQSFAYEDFVEGIKATTSAEGISYSVESGIFKKACEATNKGAGGLSLEDVFNQFLEEISEKPIVLKTPRGKEFTTSYKGGNTTITCVPHASEEKRELPASIAHIKQVLRGVRPNNIYCESYVNGIAEYLRKKLGVPKCTFYPGQEFNGYRIVEVSDELLHIAKPRGNKMLYPISILSELTALVRAGDIAVEDLKKSKWNEGINTEIDPYIVTGYYNVVPQMVEYLLSLDDQDVAAPAQEPVVLIIDEINRGNISSIFGELITLIEPSKRAGSGEALSVTLPYSKERFQVPNNLYLIGTMNTADRSLAMMDTALRRRFEFVEMMPDVKTLNSLVIKGINIAQMLLVMNKRIEVLYDREHTLGHAFFMPLKGEEDKEKQFVLLQSIFENKILPLLEEYFFEDWDKIRLVLGDNQKTDADWQFIAENTHNSSELFGNAEVDYQIEEAKSYSRNTSALSKPESYKAIYGS